MHLSNVLLPEPLRPTMPKNSPRLTSKETSVSAGKVSMSRRRNGCSARSLSVWTRSFGSENAFETPSTTTAWDRSDTAAKLADAHRRKAIPEVTARAPQDADGERVGALIDPEPGRVVRARRDAQQQPVF